MSIPQTILDSLKKVQEDADDLGTATQAQAAAEAALAEATHNRDQADGTVSSATTQLAGDKAALIALINSTYAGV